MTDLHKIRKKSRTTCLWSARLEKKIQFKTQYGGQTPSWKSKNCDISWWRRTGLSRLSAVRHLEFLELILFFKILTVSSPNSTKQTRTDFDKSADFVWSGPISVVEFGNYTTGLGWLGSRVVSMGRLKMHDLKMQDWKMTDNFARNRRV